MKRLVPRGIGMIFLLALFSMPTLLFAQDEITVVGSGIVAPLFQSVADASGAAVTASVTGTNAGFDALCAGSADVALATRAIAVEEEAVCGAAGIAFVELVVGHHILAVVANPDSNLPTCLTETELSAAFAPSSEGQITNWTQVNAEYPDSALAIVLPAQDTAAYALADSIIEGDGLRADAAVQTSDDSVISTVSETPGAVGIVPLGAALAAGESVTVLEVDAGAATGCAAPSAEAVESRLYNAADRLFVYANAASLSKPGLTDLLTAMTTESAAALVEAAGFTAPTATTYTTASGVVTNLQTGRAFSGEVTDFAVSDQVFGMVTIGGSAEAVQYIQSITGGYTAQFPSVTTDVQLKGEPAGLTSLCAGTLDIAVAYNELTAEQQAACDAANVTIENIALGSEAVVLIGNANTDFLACLTTDQLATIWQAQPADAVTTWNQVSDTFGEGAVMLFAPAGGSAATDLLLIQTAGRSVPIRPDVAEVNDDPLYRAAATGNVEGALTFMTYAEYQRVLENNQANIQLVSVDGGSGCVEPTEATIADGSYPLARPLSLQVSQASLARPEVQSFLWFLVSDENFAALQDAGFVGLSFGQLPDVRSALQAAFETAMAQAAITPEATPEATADPNATAEPVEATAEATEAAS